MIKLNDKAHHPSSNLSHGEISGSGEGSSLRYSRKIGSVSPITVKGYKREISNPTMFQSQNKLQKGGLMVPVLEKKSMNPQGKPKKKPNYGRKINDSLTAKPTSFKKNFKGVGNNKTTLESSNSGNTKRGSF